MPEKKCNWNKKSKYWRPEWVADKMRVKYVPRSEFTKEYGGRPVKDDDSTTSGRCGGLDKEERNEGD